MLRLKNLFFLAILFAGTFLQAGSEEDLINNVASGANAGSGVAGIGIIYATAWVPIAIFGAIFTVIVVMYYKKIEERDQSQGKFIASIFVGMILGYLGNYGTLKAFDYIWGDENSKKISQAYFLDIATYGLKPSQTFGSKLKEVIDGLQ